MLTGDRERFPTHNSLRTGQVRQPPVLRHYKFRIFLSWVLQGYGCWLLYFVWEAFGLRLWCCATFAALSTRRMCGYLKWVLQLVFGDFGLPKMYTINSWWSRRRTWALTSISSVAKHPSSNMRLIYGPLLFLEVEDLRGLILHKSITVGRVPLNILEVQYECIKLIAVQKIRRSTTTLPSMWFHSRRNFSTLFHLPKGVLFLSTLTHISATSVRGIKIRLDTTHHGGNHLHRKNWQVRHYAECKQPRGWKQSSWLELGSWYWFYNGEHLRRQERDHHGIWT